MIDFLIIGGGIAGMSVAAQLSRLGRVMVLEAEDSLGYHASGRSAALYEKNYGLPSTIALNEISREFHLRSKILSPRGVMLIGRADNADKFAADQRDMKLDQMDVKDAKGIVPILNDKVIDRAAYNHDAWDIDTDKLMQSFVKEARENGCQINPKSRVTGIARIASGWDITTEFANYFAKVVINAAGAWADQIAEMADIKPIGFKPLRRSMARLPAPGGHDVTRWPMLFGPGEDWYAKPDAGALLVSPGDEELVAPGDVHAEELTLAEGLMRYENHVTEPIVRMLTSWAGLRTFAPDRSLVLGPDPADETFIWCAGQGGYGMQSAPGASQLLANIVGGTASDLPDDVIAAVSPQRFV